MDRGKTDVRMAVLGLLLGMLIASLDSTIVSTALGTIVADLGGMDLFIWVTAAYLITSVAGMPIFGKLSDMYGRKLFYIFGLGAFMAGSILCGTAQNMTQLCLYRAVQGIGGGALMPIAFTIVFDIFPPEQRGKMSGLFSAVFGISSIFGPLLGAYFAEYLNWRWIFFINVPLGIVSLFLLQKFYHESLEHREQKIDWMGAGLLVVAVVSLMFLLELGGRQFGWLDWPILTLGIISLVSFLALFQVEKRASDPVVPLELFKRRLFASTQAASFFTGAAYILMGIYIPIFVQGVAGGTATNAGMILIPMMIGSVIGSQFGGTSTSKLPYRHLMLISTGMLFVGIGLLSTLTPAVSRIWIVVFTTIAGIGMGISFPVLAMASSHDMPFSQRGTANSTVSFFRLIGMTMGIAVFGTIQRGIMNRGMRDILPGGGQLHHLNDVRVLLQPAVRASVPHAALAKMTAVLAHSISAMFLWASIAALIALAAVFVMGNDSIAQPDSAYCPNEGGDDGVYVFGNTGTADGGGEASL